MDFPRIQSHVRFKQELLDIASENISTGRIFLILLFKYYIKLLFVSYKIAYNYIRFALIVSILIRLIVISYYSTVKNVLTKEMEERGYNLREPSGVLRLLETILPVLLECWVEATSSQHSHMDGKSVLVKDFRLWGQKT